MGGGGREKRAILLMSLFSRPLNARYAGDGQSTVSFSSLRSEKRDGRFPRLLQR